jgi:uncharacterized protein involved in exopolysaccharide biosynthesis
VRVSDADVGIVIPVMNNAEVTKACLERVLATAGDLAIDAYLTIPSVRTAPDLQKALQELSGAEAELRTLQLRYTDEHKLVKDAQDRVAQIRNRSIPAYTTGLVNALHNRENDLRKQVSQASGEIRGIPTRTINEARLRRDAESIAKMQSELQASYERAKLAEASAIPDVRILDPAVKKSQIVTHRGIKQLDFLSNERDGLPQVGQGQRLNQPAADLNATLGRVIEPGQ